MFGYCICGVFVFLFVLLGVSVREFGWCVEFGV